MRWCISIGAVLIAGALAGGDVAGLAAPGPKHHLADKDQAATVDVDRQEEVFMSDRQEEDWSRRGFVGGLALVGTAGLLGLQAEHVAVRVQQRLYSLPARDLD